MAKPLSDFTCQELEIELGNIGMPKFHAIQILRWIYRYNAASFDVMTDLSMQLRKELANRFAITATKVKHKYTSSDKTEKFLIELEDGNCVETVLIRDGSRKTVCISTQVGCPVKCIFCASGLEGLKRNLKVFEIVEQLLYVKRAISKDELINNVVIMGIGEPLLNFDNLSKALKTFKAEWGFGIGYNKITLSTVGTLLDRLETLIQNKITPNLALSLHAPNDRIRKQIIPTLKIPISDIINAGVNYKMATGKSVTFEYVLLKNINDHKKHALELSKKLRGKKLKVNVIPYNRVDVLPFEESPKETLDKFVATLGRGGVPVTVRRRKGDEISAACGQLRAKFKGNGK